MDCPPGHSPKLGVVWHGFCVVLMMMLLSVARSQTVCSNNTCFTSVFGLTVQNVSIFNITASSSNVAIDLCPVAPCASRMALLSNVSFLSLTFSQTSTRTDVSGVLSVILENCTIRNGMSLVNDAQFLVLRVNACTFGSRTARASIAGVVVAVNLFHVQLKFDGLVVFAAQFGIQFGPGQFNYSDAVVQGSQLDGTTAAVSLRVTSLCFGLLAIRNSELTSSSNDGVRVTTTALSMLSAAVSIQDNSISSQMNCVVANNLNTLGLESSSIVIEGNAMTSAADVPILFRSATGTLYTMVAATWTIRGNNITAARSSGAVIKLFWDHTNVDNNWTMTAESSFRIDGNSLDGGQIGVHMYWLSSSVGSLVTLSQASLWSISCNVIATTGNGIQLRWSHDTGAYEKDNVLVASQGSMVVFSGNVFPNAVAPVNLLWEWYTGSWTFADTARLLVFHNDAQGSSATALFTIAFSPAKMTLTSALPVLVVHNRANNPSVLLVSISNASTITLSWRIGCNTRVSNAVSGASAGLVSQVTGRQCDSDVDVRAYLFSCRTATPSLSNGAASATATVALSDSPTMEAWYVRRPSPASQGIVSFCTNACAQRPGGFIATPRNSMENLLVVNSLPSNVSHALLGGSRLHDNKTYRWFSGPLGSMAGGAGPVFFTNITFATGVCVTPPYFCHFNSDEPNNYPNGAPNQLLEYLIYMLGPTSGANGFWNDDNDARGTGCACFRYLGITRSGSPTLPEPSRTMASPTLSAGSRSPTHSESSVFSSSKSFGSATLLASSTRSTSASFLTRTLRQTWMVVDNETFSGVSLAATPPPPSTPFFGINNGTSSSAAPSITGVLFIFGTEFSPFLPTIRNATNCFVVPTNISRGGRENPSSSGAQRVRDFVWKTSTVTPITATAAVLELVVSNAVYFDLSETVAVEIGVDGACLARADLSMLTTTIYITPAVFSPANTDLLRNSQIVASTLTVVNPIVAVQAQRNTLALTLRYCVLDRDVGMAQSPTRIALGQTAVSAYVGAAVMNFALVLGVAVVQLVIAAVASCGGFTDSVGTGAQRAFAAARFPSVLAIPAMMLLEPTASSAVIATLYGEELAFVGIVSLVLCVATPLVVGVYLRTTFAAVVVDRASVDHPVVPSPSQFMATSGSDGVGNEKGENHKLAAASINPLYGFVFGYGKWVDNTKRYGSAAAGFCQRNRYFFKEYREGCQWYMIVELAMAVLLGSLEGIKLGYGQCTEVLLTATVLMSLYLVAFLRFRPCISGCSNLFIVCLTSLQTATCILLLLPGEHTQTAVTIAGVASYLLLAKCCIDVMEVVSHVYHKLRHRYNVSKERHQAERQRQQDIDALAEYDIPLAIASLPLSVLMDVVSKKASQFPLLQKHRVVDLLNDHGFRGLPSLSAALTACVDENTENMKQSASFKYSVDGVWRDWRDEATAVPVELVALASQLRGITLGTGSNAVKKPPQVKKPLAPPRRDATVVVGDLIVHDAGDEPSLPLLSKDDATEDSDNAIELQDMTLQAILEADPDTSLSHHHAVFHSNMDVDDNGLLVFGVKDDPWFPEEERDDA